MSTTSDRVPSIFRQGFDVRLIETEPGVRNYNSGLILSKKKLFIATRRFCHRLHRCDIDINHVTESKVTRVRTLDLPRAHGREQFEDGRLFRHREKLYLAYTEGRYWALPYLSVQKVARLNEGTWAVEQVYTIGYGHNTLKSEKNWQFFSDGDALFFTYSISPHIVVELDDEFNVTADHYTPNAIQWPYGTLSGGTPPVKVGSRFVSFFHSYTNHPTRARRYSFSAYEFEAKSPYRITRITTPLMTASGDDMTLPNPTHPHWQPIVIFPCGAAMANNRWLITAGVNDSYDVRIIIPHADLESRFIPVERFTEKDAGTRYFETLNPSRPIKHQDRYIEWDHVSGNPLLGARKGFKVVKHMNQSEAHTLSEARGVTEIDHNTYRKQTSNAAA